jgi:hypothetical protein
MKLFTLLFVVLISVSFPTLVNDVKVVRIPMGQMMRLLNTPFKAVYHTFGRITFSKIQFEI